MAKEFEIVSKINLDTDEAMSKWQKFKSEAKELEKIDLKIQISNLDSITKELQNLVKLSDKLSSSSSKLKIGSDSSNIKEQTEALEKYKDTYRTIQKLQQQQSKATNESTFKKLGSDIDQLESKLSTLKSKITDGGLKLELFEFKQQNAELVQFERTLTSLTSKAEKLQTSFNSIDFKNVNTSTLESDITQLMSRIEQLQVLGREGVDVKVDLNNALSEVERLKSVLSNFTELDKIKSEFASLESEIKDSLGTEAVDKLRSEMEQLESSVMQVDGSFDRLSSGVKSNLSSAASSVKRMNSELKSSSRFMSDFTGSFYAYTAGNVIGDGIVRGIRSIKDAYLEIDSAITNVIKVADNVETNTVAKLDSIKQKSVEIAKDVGQSSADVLNAIADTVQAGVAKTLEGSMDIAKQAMMFANVGELSQEMSSSMVNTMIRGFNVDPVTKYRKEVNGVSQEVTGLTVSMDALNYASNNYGASAEQLSNGIQNGGNVLGAYGVTLNDTIGLITAGVEVLGDGNKIGNGLKSIAINLAGIKASADTGELSLNKTAKTLQEVAGIDVYSDKKNGQMKDMVTILDEVQGKWKDLTDEQQKGLSEAIAGKQQSAVFTAIMSNYEQFKKLQGELSQDMHLGSMEAENAKYVDSISGKLNSLKETWLSIGSSMVSSDFTKGLLDSAISISEAIDNIVKSLDGMGALTPVVTGLGLSFVSMMKSISKGTGSSFGITNTFKDINAGLKSSDTLMNKLKSTSSTVFGTIGSKIASAGKYLGSFLAQGAMIAGVTFAVQQLAKAWDYAANGLKNAEKEIKNNIEELQDSVNNDKSNLSYLNEIEVRYNELIKKKKEYAQTPVEDWTDKQVSDMEELKSITAELSEIFPELVIGYDEAGSPIMLMADDMSRLKERTQEQIDLQNELLRIQREELADNARKQVQDGEFFGFGSGVAEDISLKQSVYDSLYDTIKANEEGYTKAVLEGNDKRAKSLAKTISEQKKNLADNYNEQVKLYQEYAKKELEIQQSAYDQIQAKKNYSSLDGENLSNVQNLLDNLNWAGMDESQYNSWVGAFDKVIKLASEGSPKVAEWNKALEDANKSYANTGDLDKYNKVLGDLATTISSELNIPYETVFSGLENMVMPLTEAEKDLNNFLNTFNKTRDDLLKGDNIATGLAEQFQAINDVIDNVFGNKSSFKDNGALKFSVAAEISNMDELPKQVRELTAKLSEGGVTKQESEIIVGLMYSLREGNTEETRAKIEELNKTLEDMGLEEHKIDIETLFEDNGATEKISELENALNSFREEKSLKLLIDLVGEDKAKLYSEIIEKLPVNAEYTNKFIVENEDALSKMETYQEVLNYINELPSEVRKSYGFDIDGNDKVIQAVTETQEAVDSLDGDSATVEVDADTSDAEDGVDELIDKKEELEEPTNLTVNKGELQGSVEDFNKLIEYSTKLKDGEYQISFKSDTADAIAQIDNLKLAVNNLSNQFREIPSTTVTLETSVAAKNISGLLVRINEAKTAISGLQGKTIEIITARSAMNLSGLITRVNQYKTAIGSVSTKTCEISTAQAAKNLSGLISKIDSYNSKTIPAKKVDVNTSSAISKLNTLISKINSLPSTKTVTVKVNQSGSVSQIANSLSRSVQSDAVEVAPASLEESNKIALLSDNGEATPVENTNVQNPNARNYSKPLDVVKYGYDYFIELENQLKKINAQLDLLDEKAKNAFGPDKITYLNQQINLYKEQQKVQQSLINDMNKYQSSLKSFLSGKGFGFDSIGNVTNYHEKLIAMENELKRLEDIANKENSSDAQKNAYNNYKDQLDEIKKVMSEYIDITFNDLPNARKEWEELSNSINDASKEIDGIKSGSNELINTAKVYELTDAYKDLEHELNKIDKLLNNANGKNKIELLNKQLDILKQQKVELEKQYGLLTSQKNMLKSQLSNLGFSFDSSNDITNYANQLSNLYNQGKDMDEITDILDKYFDLQNDKLPDLIEDWMDLDNSLKDITDDIESIRLEQQKLVDEAKVHALTDAYKDLEHELNKVSKQLEHSNGKGRLDLLDKQLSILEQQKSELEKQEALLTSQKNSLKSQLSGYGFSFDSTGDITNHVDQLNNLFDTGKDIDKINDLLEEYFKLQNDELPGIAEDWLDLDNAIKDVLKDQLETTSKIEKQITEMYKKQIEDRIKQMEKETDAKIKELDKQKKAYNSYRDEVDYQRDYDDQMDVISDLEKQIELAKRDTSLSGQKKLQDLMNQLVEEQRKLEDLVQENIDKQVNDMFDKESDKLQEENDKAIEDLENQWSDSKIAEMVAAALGSGVFTDIEGQVYSLEDALINFAKESGDLFGVLGSTIQDELIGNLNIALDTFKELSDILKDLNINEISVSAGRMSVPTVDSYSAKSVSSTVNFNQPLCVIEGNVTEDVIQELDEKFVEIKDEIVNAIVSEMR